MKEKIFFAHANGFPAEVYNDLFKQLPQFDISYISKLAHGKFTLKSLWKDITLEIIEYLEANYTKPVWAIGHSFGAVILAFAAEQRPDLFKGLIMMDPPVLSWKIRWGGWPSVNSSEFRIRLCPWQKKQQIKSITKLFLDKKCSLKSRK